MSVVRMSTTAQAMPKGATLEEVDEKIADGEAPPVTLPKDVTPRLLSNFDSGKK